ncbi:MAG: hypothetical protein IKY67_11970 [Paludibacteraceae bacterium]|nr:hypothetical protein [Paludibacteraceae bacterium]
MKLKTLLIATFSLLLIFCSCKTHKPVATASHERIETQMQPIETPNDSVVITLATPTPQPIKIVSFETSRPALISHVYFDTLQQLKINLKPDTIYMPYTTHIRSDTIVAPDPTTKAKMQKTQTANLLLILIIIAIIIIFLILRQNDKKT